MDREVQWARGKPDEAQMTAFLAATAMYFGKLRQAEEFHKRAVELFKALDRTENASTELLNFASYLLLIGKCDQAKNKAKESLALFRGQFGVAGSAMLFASCEDSSQAEQLLEHARVNQPKNTVLLSMVAPMLRSAIEKNRGNTAEAIRLSESVRAYDFGRITGLGTAYMRGNLYLEQRMGNEAAAEFKKIIDTPGIEPASPAHPLSHLGLARAEVLKGDTAAARKSYQDFFGLWKDADQDLPVLVQAKKEYKQLK
jgi:tetratricopeptide (TPR) repeat protein